VIGPAYALSFFDPDRELYGTARSGATILFEGRKPAAHAGGPELQDEGEPPLPNMRPHSRGAPEQRSSALFSPCRDALVVCWRPRSSHVSKPVLELLARAQHVPARLKLRVHVAGAVRIGARVWSLQRHANPLRSNGALQMSDRNKPHNGRDRSGHFKVRQEDVDDLQTDPNGADFVRDDVRLGGAIEDTGPLAGQRGARIAKLIEENREITARGVSSSDRQGGRRKRGQPRRRGRR
jgi:hypothetical protein